MFINFGTRLFYWSTHLLVYHQVSFSGKFTKLREATISFIISVRPSAWNSSAASTGRMFMKFDIRVFFENILRKLEFRYDLAG